MNSRARFLSSVAHTQPDRVPIGLRFSPELAATLKEAFGFKDDHALLDWAGCDLRTVRPKFRRPAADRQYADPTIEVTPDGLHLDIYRVPFRLVQTACQRYMEPAGQPPLAQFQSAGELAAWNCPGPELWDFSGIASELTAHHDRATWGRSRGIFEISCFLRGMDRFMLDLALEPDFAAALLDRVMDGLLALARNTLEAGRGGYAFYEYNDDIGSQRTMTISPQMWREFIKPRMARFCDLIHSFGAKVRYHSCGSIRPVIPDLIEIGVDILNPIQPLARDMDPTRLKAEFGTHLCFDGGIDTQALLPNGTPGDVRAEVRRMIDQVGRDGGYILAGSHTLQADVPIANVVAMIEEAKK